MHQLSIAAQKSHERKLERQKSKQFEQPPKEGTMQYFKLAVKDEKLLEENRYLREEFDNLKGLTEIWFHEKDLML